MAAPDYSFTHRKRLPHGVIYFDAQPTIVFDTVCTKHRRPWLTSPAVHALLRKIWSQASLWLVGRYVVMPDHIHLFAAATADSPDYEHWCRYWKSQFTKCHQEPLHRWQQNHWDTRMRSRDQYEEKWEYVRNNPVRAGLIECSEDWPYQGVLHSFSWD